MIDTVFATKAIKFLSREIKEHELENSRLKIHLPVQGLDISYFMVIRTSSDLDYVHVQLDGYVLIIMELSAIVYDVESMEKNAQVLNGSNEKFDTWTACRLSIRWSSCLRTVWKTFTGMFYEIWRKRCGVCSAQFNTQAAVRDHERPSSGAVCRLIR